MALKTFRPVTPTLRHTVLIDRSELWKGDPIKALTIGKREQGGRNNLGRITQRWRGGGHKKRYRLVDFKRGKMDMPAEVVRLEYDPNRSGFIALIKYNDGELSYILAPQVTRCCVSPPARCARCAPTAWRRSVRCRIPTSRTWSSARPAVRGGLAGAAMFAARR